MRTIKFIIFVFIVMVCLQIILPAFSFASSSDKDVDVKSTYLQEALNQEDAPTVPHGDVQLPNIFDTIIRFFISLLIIVGLIWGSAVLYKKINGAQYFLAGEGEIIKVLERRYIDQKSSLQIIDIAGELFLIGTGLDGIRHVSEISSEDTKARIHNLVELRSEQYKAPDFKRMLAGFSDKGKIKESVTISNDGSSSSSKLQANIEKIKKMLHEKK